MDFQLLDFSGRAQAEMQARIRAGGVAASAEDVSTLADSSGSQEHFCADSIAGTLGTADEFQSHPVVGILDHVPKQGGRRVHIVEDNNDVASPPTLLWNVVKNANHWVT